MVALVHLGVRLVTVVEAVVLALLVEPLLEQLLGEEYLVMAGMVWLQALPEVQLLVLAAGLEADGVLAQLALPVLVVLVPVEMQMALPVVPQLQILVVAVAVVVVVARLAALAAQALSSFATLAHSAAQAAPSHLLSATRSTPLRPLARSRHKE